MSASKTVVISCAGMGSRLGMNIPKSLIMLHGKPLIEWQLELLKNVEDVRIVVGYKYQEVINVVLKKRKDVTFIFNHEFRTTGTAASFARGAEYVNLDNLVLSLDGDLLVHPDDFDKLLLSNFECVGVGLVSSEEPVYINTYESNGIEWADSFSRLHGKYEWTGLVQLKAEKVTRTTGHVYQMLEPMLPFRVFPVRTHEIDTYLDYINALEWVLKVYNLED